MNKRAKIMNKMTNIFIKLQKALFLFLVSAYFAAVLPVFYATAQEEASQTSIYKNAKDYYEKEAKDIKINEKVSNILERIANVDKPWYKDVGDFIKDSIKASTNFAAAEFGADVSGVVGVDKEAIYYMEQLRNLARGEAVYNDASSLRQNVKQAVLDGNYYQYGSVVGEDSVAEDIREKLSISLKYALDYGSLSPEEAQLIENEASRLLQVGAEHAKNAAKADGKNLDDNITKATAGALNPENTVSAGLCPSSDFLRQKYHSGCWSCLVVKNLTSAFLSAASKAYGLSQRAGITLLWIGVTLWLLMWALKNVSSLAQVEPGNILNELIKFMFKVGLSYWFIMGGLPMVRNYFISPIMGFGASIAQQFWPEQLEGYVEEYKWDTLTDEDYKEVMEAPVTTPVPTQEDVQEQTPAVTPVVYDEVQQHLIDKAKEQEKAFGETGIPNLLVPGCNQGCLTSPFGKRKSPCTGCSSCHKGVDVGAGCTGKNALNECIPVFAAGPGIINYHTQRNSKGKITGAGYYAKIDHGKVGKHNWKTVYMHMRGFSEAKFKKSFPNGQVAQGQQIGCIGNSGVGTGPHLHFSIIMDNKYIDPLSLTQGKIITETTACEGSSISTYPKPFSQGKAVGKGWPAAGKAVLDLSATYETSNETGFSASDSSVDFKSLIIPIDDVKFDDKDPTDIMPKSVMNSILGATKAITNITAENMILGDAIMCYSTLERGGAWVLNPGWWAPTIYITNAFMWIEGFIIFCFGMLLTLAIVYYLMDMSFKIGFAVIALPIVVGLWPFNMTKGKFGTCISIIAKAAATFAFLALTTTYTVALTEAVINWGDPAEVVSDGKGGIAKLYEIMDEAGNIKNIGQDRKEDNIEYAAAKLSLFSTTFVMLLFAFLYSFKLVQNTVPDLVNKFFLDKAFGETNPMHQWATAASRWVKDQAMKPVGYARDIALNQAGNALKGMPGKAVGFAKSMAGKGSGDSKTLAGRGMRGIGGLTKFAGKAMSAVGMKGAGGKLQAVGQKMKDAGNATDKAYNEFGTRNKKSEGDKDK